LNQSSSNLRVLFDMITDLGKEYLARERQTLKVLNNQELGKQLQRLCHANGEESVAQDAAQFVIKKGQSQVAVVIVEDKSSSPHAAVTINVTGVDSKDLLGSIKMLLQNAVK
tara:strand:- start:1313 stop:1648 length:336 start_codon:yes stop_codon:yes gene_type:complete